MANPNPVIRTEEQELQRQLSWNKTLRAQAPEKAQQKLDEQVAKYTERIETIEARLAELRN